ncbi:MAG: hypothetical protein AMXMBFR13_49110 [Phycisphaerae bacterium]
MPKKNDLSFVYLVLAGFLLLILLLSVPLPNRSRDMARKIVTQAELKAIEKAVLRFYQDVGRYPPDLESLCSPADQPAEWRGPYLDLPKIRPDAWDRPLIYHLPPEGPPTIMSYGADGQPGGTGKDEDIIVRPVPATRPSTSSAIAQPSAGAVTKAGD